MVDPDATDDVLDVFITRVEASTHNLVSRRAQAELRDRHLPECEAFAQMLPTGPATLLDLGTGGGFPGFVIAVTRPDLKVVLLDGTRKKVEFVEGVAEDLGVQLHTLHGRAEELQRTKLASSFDLVTARAVAPLERLIPWTVPFLRPGGLLYAIKGVRWPEEVRAAADVLRMSGAEIVATPDDVVEKHSDHEPMVVIIRRTPGATS